MGVGPLHIIITAQGLINYTARCKKEYHSDIQRTLNINTSTIELPSGDVLTPPHSTVIFHVEVFLVISTFPLELAFPNVVPDIVLPLYLTISFPFLCAFSTRGTRARARRNH